ncbi:MAG: VWA domain-containing protein [Acidobacteria bacterium]|nr:VWA domain-containing protein [Acidobacteriota bacterium]
MRSSATRQIRLFLGCFCCAYAFADAMTLAQSRQSAVQEKRDPIVDAQFLRVETQLVNVIFSATDKRNKLITDLVSAEVEVLEEGQPQPIFTFKPVMDLPLTVALLVDISNSVRPVLAQLQLASLRFLESAIQSTKDTASVITFDEQATLIQSFTSNKERLRAGLSEVVNPLIGSSVGLNRARGTSIYDAVYVACRELLPGEAGHKTIILFTDGFDSASKITLRKAISEALRAEVAIYAIGIGDQGDKGVARQVLKQLCQETGGRAFLPQSTADLSAAFAQLQQDLRQRYLLAYEPTVLANDTSFRHIEVRLKSRKGASVNHRQGYFPVQQPLRH